MARSAQAAIILDDFNVNEGHFSSSPTLSGSTVGLTTTGSTTADRDTTTSIEGSGSEKLVLVHNTSTTATRLRFLSGGGTPANNTGIVTSAGTDGWIGMYVKTSGTADTGWTVQIWLEMNPASTATADNSGSIPKAVIADGQWHLYEWNLDDTSGGADGWGTISGIQAGSATVKDGTHAIDSVIFRDGTLANSTLYMDFLAINPNGSVADLLVPEPTSLALFALASPLFLRRRRQT
jgi:hypothetical protein